MKLEFVELEISGFKSFDYGRLELDDHKAGLHFLRGRNEVEPRLGSNGAGKTTLWDALTWALYGRTISGLRNTDVQSRRKKKTHVTVSITIDGKPHRIRRSANPNSLVIDGEAAGQEQVDALLGMSISTFGHAVLLGQGQPLFFDLQPREKMQLFSDVLNLDRWDARAKAAGVRAAETSNRQAELEGERVGHEKQIEAVDAQLKAGKKASDMWEEGHSHGLAKAEAELADVSKRLKQAQDKEAKLDLELERIELLIPDLETETQAAQDEYNEANSVNREEQFKLEQLRSQASKLRTELKTMKSWNECPICKRSLKGTSVEAHAKEVGKELAALEDKIGKGVPVSVIRRLKSADKALGAATKKAEAALSEAKTARLAADPLRQTVADLKANKARLETTLSEREEQVNPYSEQLAQGRKLLAKSKAAVKELGKAIAAAARSQERAKFWTKGFKDVRLFVIDEVLAELELTTNAGLEAVGLIGWSVKYAVERETKSGSTSAGLNVVILGPDMADGRKWEAWSGGEGQRLRLVGALALSEVLLNYAGVECSLEILDEPTRHLSEDGVRDLVEFLGDRARSLGRSTWLVDHMAIESSAFDSVVTIVKDARVGSYIEGQGKTPA